MSGQAIGSVITGLIISQLSEIKKQGAYFLGSVGIFGLTTILFGLSNSFYLSMFALMIMGSADSISTIIRNTIRQLQTPDNIRGRMTSINQIFFMGGPQLGEVEAGVVGSLFGIQTAIVTGGIGTILALIFIMSKFPILLSYSGHPSEHSPEIVK